MDQKDSIPLGVCHSAHILAGGVIDRLVIEGHPLVGAGLISEHRGAMGGVLGNKVLERRLVGCRDSPRRHAVGGPVLDPCNSKLANSTAPRWRGWSGTHNRDIESAEEIWAFLRQFRKGDAQA